MTFISSSLLKLILYWRCCIVISTVCSVKKVLTSDTLLCHCYHHIHVEGSLSKVLAGLSPELGHATVRCTTTLREKKMKKNEKKIFETTTFLPALLWWFSGDACRTKKVEKKTGKGGKKTTGTSLELMSKGCSLFPLFFPYHCGYINGCGQ